MSRKKNLSRYNRTKSARTVLLGCKVRIRSRTPISSVSQLHIALKKSPARSFLLKYLKTCASCLYFSRKKERWRSPAGHMLPAKPCCAFHMKHRRLSMLHCTLHVGHVKRAIRHCLFTAGHVTLAIRRCKLTLRRCKLATGHVKLTLRRCKLATGHVKLTSWHCKLPMRHVKPAT